jgi:hypothetical protein
LECISRLLVWEGSGQEGEVAVFLQRRNMMPFIEKCCFSHNDSIREVALCILEQVDASKSGFAGEL